MDSSLIILAFSNRFSSVGKFMSSDPVFLSNYTDINYIEFNPRNMFSLVEAFCKIGLLKIKKKSILFSVPRSNSRGLILLAWLFRPVHLITYSDGLGDTSHSCGFEAWEGYQGHVGFDAFGATRFFYRVPLRLLLETWITNFKYCTEGVVLVILKSPKEVEYSRSLLKKQYARIIDGYLRTEAVVVSGEVSLLPKKYLARVKILPMLTKLEEVIFIKKIISLPSTAIISFSTMMPMSEIKVMKLVFSSIQYQAFSRYYDMRTDLMTVCRAIKKGK